MADTSEDFITTRNEAHNALQEFKEACEADGEDFEAEVADIIEDLE